jgi:CO/xanthine dehydrogenase FAD-binding subunit
MDWQTLINVGASIALAVVAEFARRVHAREDRQDERIALNGAAISAVRVEMAKEYVTREDLQDIKALLIRIDEKLDKKADK